MSSHVINGFSKLTRKEKMTWLQKQAGLSQTTVELLNKHLHPEKSLQGIYGDISENNISNFFLPLGLAPNFLINDKLITIPMVIEESSVVAAASFAAKFWAMHGGFHTEVSGTLKTGQVHFTWSGTEKDLEDAFNKNKEDLLHSVKSFTHRMEQRGGGIRDIKIKAIGPNLPGFYQLFITFQTANAMGANFINSVLETMAEQFATRLTGTEVLGELEIVMSILSNYTPDCRVTCYVEAETSVFEGLDPSKSGDEFALKFKKAVQVAVHDPYRAVTHNKGIFNGMDAVVLATGNDFRAVEACGHAYASRNGTYASLSTVDISEKTFRFTLDVPLAIGTVGGLTGNHPLAGAALEILDFPTAEQLMQIIAAAGLANNFSAVRSLITSGIQQGHMKMHLTNILRQLNATPAESIKAISFFKDKPISHAAVADFLKSNLDQNKPQ